MVASHSLEAKPVPLQSEATPRALVIGGGTAAVIAARAVKDLGNNVTFVRLVDVSDHLYFSVPDSDACGGFQDLSFACGDMEIIDIVRPPVVQRERGVFRALLEDGTELVSDCVLLAPGLSLKPKPPTLPDKTELFQCGIEMRPGEHVAFMMDYQDPSHPALGMSAIQAAAQNVRDGGTSVVYFRNVPVVHVFGETLYDSARRIGVQFVRYGDDLPAVRQFSEGESPKQFQVTVEDVIDRENPSVFDCDRIVAVTGPDASSIPEWAGKLVNGDVDANGFMLSESIHCSSGRSFAGGVFVVGEATGSLDLIGCVAQAKATAAHASAWMRESRLRREHELVSVSQACARCLTCHRVCPHAAISVYPQTSRTRIEPSPSFCRECGICVSVCPSGAMTPRDCPDESIVGFVLDAADISRTTFVFGCRRSAGVIAESIHMPEYVRFLAVPCAGRVSDYAIWSTLAAGARGVLVVGCHHGNCASRTGSHWAAARIERARGIDVGDGGPRRIGYITIAPNESARFQRLLNEFVAGHFS